MPADAAAPPPARSSGGHIRLTSHSAGATRPRCTGARPPRPSAARSSAPPPRAPTATSSAPTAAPTGCTGRWPSPPGKLSREHRADLTDTSPTDVIGPHPQWTDPAAIVSLDPWGATVADVFADQIAAGIDIRPDHRGDQGAGDPARGARRDPQGPVEPGRPGTARDRGRAGDQGRARTGLAPARRRAAVRLQRKRPAPSAFRGNRRHVPGAGHPLGPRGVPAARSAARRSTSSATRARWPTPASN